MCGYLRLQLYVKIRTPPVLRQKSRQAYNAINRKSEEVRFSFQLPDPLRNIRRLRSKYKNVVFESAKIPQSMFGSPLGVGYSMSFTHVENRRVGDVS